jgi:hypothetical protein
MEVSGQLHDSAALLPGKELPDIQRIGGWVEVRTSIDAVQKRKYLAPAGNRTQVVQPVVRRYTKWIIPALLLYSKTCLKRNLKGPEHFSAEARFRLIKVYYDSHGTWKYFRLIKGPFKTDFTVLLDFSVAYLLMVSVAQTI